MADISIEARTDHRLHDFIGNSRLVRGLVQAIATGQMVHAYLITGVPGIGKKTLALALAQALLCGRRGDGDGDACGTCSHCRRVQHGNHPDLVRLELPKDKQHYSIEQIRDLIELAALKPLEATSRVFIIPEADLLTIQAINAMLKILEEPPANGKILLTCTSTELLLPTVISRCQEIPLAPVPTDILARALQENYGCDASLATRLALLGGGRPGWAIETLHHPETVEERRQQLHDLARIVTLGRAERIAAAGQYAGDREQARQMIDLLLPWWHDVMLAAYGATDAVRNRDDLALIQQQAQDFGPVAASRFLQAQLEALQALEFNANPRLTIEVMLQALPGVS